MAYNYIIELPLLLSFHRISSIAPGRTPEAVVAATQIPWSTPLTGWFCTRAVNYWVRKADDCQREAYRGTKLLFEIFKSGSFAASSSCRTAYDWRLSCGQVLDMEIVKTNSFSLRALHWTWSWRRALRRNQPTASRVVNANVMFWILSLRLSDTLRWWRWDFWPKWRSMFRERELRRLLGWAGADAALECACINYDDSLESPSRWGCRCWSMEGAHVLNFNYLSTGCRWTHTTGRIFDPCPWSQPMQKSGTFGGEQHIFNISDCLSGSDNAKRKLLLQITEAPKNRIVPRCS